MPRKMEIRLIKRSKPQTDLPQSKPEPVQPEPEKLSQKEHAGSKSAVREKFEAELKSGYNLSIVSLVNHLIEMAYNLRASDIHIDPAADDVRIRLRIDGVLQDESPAPKNIHSEIISRIKIMAG